MASGSLDKAGAPPALLPDAASSSDSAPLRVAQRAASVAARVPRAAWVWLDSVDLVAAFSAPVPTLQSVPYFMHAGARPRGRSHSVLCSPPLQPGAARGSARGNCSFCSRVCCSCGLRPTVELVRLRFFSAWRTSTRGDGPRCVTRQWLPGLDRPPRLPLRARARLRPGQARRFVSGPPNAHGRRSGAGQRGQSAYSLEQHAETRDRAGDLQIFSLTLSQLSYRGFCTEKHVQQ